MMYLLFFCLTAFAQDSSFEARMHRIYVQHYQQPILDDDWFKITEGVQEQAYKVNVGDTLWDISEIYFGDGHYWSKLWSINKGITNPHLIFPGDTVVFSLGNFDESPSMSVEKLEQTIADSQNASDPTIMIETEPVVQSKGKFYSKPPPFFVESPLLNLVEESSVSVIPRPTMKYKNDFYLTKEIFSSEPKLVATVKSIGGERMVSGEFNRIILETNENTLNSGDTFSVIDENAERLNGGFGIHILGIVKVLQNIGDHLYEAEVLRQFDGILVGSGVITHLPPYVSMNTQQAPIEADVSILSHDKEIWYTGDVVFLKSQASSLNVGDVLRINNKFDSKVDFYTQNGVIKVVAAQAPFATAVVVHARTAMDRSSVSSPKKSGFSFW
jgi:LysM domain